MSASPIYVGTWKSAIKSLYSGHSSRPVIVAVADASGSRVHAINVACSDGSANNVATYLCKPVTLQSNMGTGAFVDGGGSSDTITRSVGSYVTDGWKIGDKLLVSGATTLGNDFLTTITGVSGTTLTFATATVASAENLPTGAILYRATQLAIDAVPINSGNSATVPSVNVLNGNLSTIDDSPNAYLTLGALEALAFAATTALGSGEFMDVSLSYGDY